MTVFHCSIQKSALFWDKGDRVCRINKERMKNIVKEMDKPSELFDVLG